MKWFRQPQILVYIQLLAIFYFVVAGLWAATGFWLWVELVGLVIALWALGAMGIRTFSVFPQPKSEGKFTMGGPYGLVRHPMYTGLLLVALSLTVSYFSWTTLSVLLILVTVISIKIGIEEEMLRHKYSGYEEYRKKTKRLIPFIW